MLNEIKWCLIKCTNALTMSRYRMRVKGIYRSSKSQTFLRRYRINGFTKDSQEFSRADVHPLRKCTCEIYETYVYLRMNANVTYLTYLGRTKIRQNSHSFSISLSRFLLYELVYKRLCRVRTDRSYQYLFSAILFAASLSFR